MLQEIFPVDSNIGQLLEEIAQARTRLDALIQDSRQQQERLAENCRQLSVTFNAVRESGSWFLQAARPQKRKDGFVNRDIEKLTKREVEVLRLISEGLSTKEIAHRLGISFKTAVSHRTHLLRKLDCHESATLVRIAIRAVVIR